MIRAKFMVTEITNFTWGNTRITMRPQYDPDLLEDKSFAKATPNGELWMDVDNPSAIEELTLGRVFYLDFVPVENVKIVQD
jgi:hypothetical protein